MTNKSRKLFLAAGWAVLLIAFCFFAFYLNRTVDGRLDADDSSELVLSALLAREGRIITPNWYYSTEVRVLNTNVVWAPLFKVFSSWHAVRVTGSLLMVLILLASVVFLLRRFGYRDIAPWAAAFFCVPFSADYYEFVIERSYYIPHIATILFAAGVLGGLLRKEKGIGTAAGAAAGILLAFAAGLGGPRVPVLFYIPMMLSAVWILFSLETVPPACRIRALVFSAASCAAAALGFIINQMVFPRFFRFDTYASLAFSTVNAERLFLSFSDLLTCYGWKTGMASYLTLTANGTAMAVFMLSLYASFQGIRKGGAGLSALSALYLSAVFVQTCAYTFSNLLLYSRYSLPTAALGILVTLCWARDGIREKAGMLRLDSRGKGRAAFALACLWVLAVSAVALFGYRDVGRDPRSNLELRQTAEFAKSEGYACGYSSFWNGNILTELTDGAVEMRTFCRAGTEDVRYVGETAEWLQEAGREDRIPEGKVFLLLEDGQLAACRWKSNLRDEDLKFRTDTYRLYGYDSFEAMKSRLYSSYRYEFSNSAYCTNGADRDGIRTLRENGSSRGPAVFLNAGRYRVRIAGKNLDGLECSCVSDGGASAFDIQNAAAEAADGKQVLTFEIALESDCDDFELVIVNRSPKDAALESAEIERTGGA